MHDPEREVRGSPITRIGARRRLIFSLLLIPILLTGCGDATSPGNSRPQTVGRDGPVHSAQLHLHGSFSEGVGSFDSHGHEARDLKVDVLWWSDHDFRIASFRQPSRYGFEAEEEPVGRNESWKSRSSDSYTKGIMSDPRLNHRGGHHEFNSREALEGSASLKFTLVEEGRDFAPYGVSIRAGRAGLRRSLAAGLGPGRDHRLGICRIPPRFGDALRFWWAAELAPSGARDTRRDPAACTRWSKDRGRRIRRRSPGCVGAEQKRRADLGDKGCGFAAGAVAALARAQRPRARTDARPLPAPASPETPSPCCLARLAQCSTRTLSSSNSAGRYRRSLARATRASVRCSLPMPRGNSASGQTS